MEMNLRSRVDATLLELQREKQVNASLQQQIEDAEHRLLEAATTCSLRLDNEKLRALELRRKIRAAKEEELHTSLATMLEKDAKEAEEKCIEVFSEQSSMFLDHLKSVKRGDPLPSKVRIALRDVHNLEMRMEGAIKKLFSLRALRRKNIWTKSELELLSKHYVTAAKNYESKQSEADALSRHWNAEQQRREKAEGKVKPLKTRKNVLLRDELGATQQLVSVQVEAEHVRNEENRDRTLRGLMRAHDVSMGGAPSTPSGRDFLREAKGKLRHAMDSIERELVDRRKRLPNKTGPENERVLNQLARFRRQMSELMQDAESWRKKRMRHAMPCMTTSQRTA